MTKESIENWLCENFDVDPDRDRLNVVEHTGHDIVCYIEKYIKSRQFVSDFLVDFVKKEIFIEDDKYARFLANAYFLRSVMSFDDVSNLVKGITKEDLLHDIGQVIVEVISNYGSKIT